MYTYITDFLNHYELEILSHRYLNGNVLTEGTYKSYRLQTTWGLYSQRHFSQTQIIAQHKNLTIPGDSL
jgi:hypothetical protein